MFVNLIPAIEARREVAINRYLVGLRFTSQLLGGQPKSRNVLRKWLEGKHLDEETIAKQEAAIPVSELIENKEDASWNVFMGDDEGIYIGAYQVKALFREMLSVLGITVSQRGSKQTYQHLMEIVAVDAKGAPIPGEKSTRIRVYRDGIMQPKAEAWIERTVHAMTPQGPRSSIVRNDCFEPGVTVTFAVHVPASLPEARKSAVIGDEELVKAMTHAGNDGLGASRSQGFGRFDVIRFERVTDNVPFLAGPKKGKKGKAVEEDEEADADPVAG